MKGINKLLMIGAGLTLSLTGFAARGLYTRVEGGYTYAPSVHVNEAATEHMRIHLRDGLSARAALGYQFNDWWSADLSAAYYRTKVRSIIFNGIDQGDDRGNQRAYAYMGNVTLDLPNLKVWRIQPYIGAGLGWVNTRFIDVDNLTTGTIIDDNSETAFAYQGTAGFRYDLASHLSLQLDYQYIRSGNEQYTFTSNAGTANADEHFTNHSFNLGVKYRF